MSLARRHRDRILASQTVASAPDGGAAAAPAAAPLPAAGAANAAPADRAAAQIALRLTHDLRRLKEIKSIDLKIAAKREMLPHYRDWLVGLHKADAGVGSGIAAEVLPTCMVWMIDVGEYSDALDLAEFMMRHRVEMPARYQRDTATVILEEIAEAALKTQAAGEEFPLAILDGADHLTHGEDMHDQARAKLLKAIGVEQLRRAEESEASTSAPRLNAALDALREAQRLHDRIGVKDRIRRAEKLLVAVTPEPEETNEQGGQNAA
ncbi:phage terminase small subunit [Novosphingobium sp. PP1Y]|uniref:phage terminase small subunit n=1 Tax=Novosphingobium sp. PP1Y TaxID=702113 RepID=UPI00020EE7DB|nr:phage terminase small subunit [Novosphingobium sp. PP1Y]CCA91325.1 phage P2 small terminase subunit gpM-like protein [Novosphingobium sp. PP1Y]